jgi:plasmid stabilization system protein ParE
MSYRVRLTKTARDDLKRLHTFMLQQDIEAAKRAREALASAFSFLQTFPFSCRKVSSDSPFLREMVIPFGSAGYVALFEVEEGNVVTILAVRHQREEDYH